MLIPVIIPVLIKRDYWTGPHKLFERKINWFGKRGNIWRNTSKFNINLCAYAVFLCTFIYVRTQYLFVLFTADKIRSSKYW